MPLPSELFKVFLSHSEKDRLLTWRIRETLDRLHIRTFVYEYYRLGGSNRFERIKENIRNAPHFVALLTSNGLASQWVNQEIGFAVGVGKSIIPIVEIDPATGKRLESHGFVELHDQILLNPSQLDIMVKDLVYTFYSWLNKNKSWADGIWLTCRCGHEFDGALNYREIKSHPEWTIRSWKCAKCGTSLEIGLPGFSLNFLEPSKAELPEPFKGPPPWLKPIKKSPFEPPPKPPFT